MILTEKEAMDKTCCGAFSVHPDTDGRCMASFCMAWRWMPDKDGDSMKKEGDGFAETGYCGLAGMPNR